MCFPKNNIHLYTIDAGAIGKELYGRIAGARRIVRLVVTAAARKQCGRSED